MLKRKWCRPAKWMTSKGPLLLSLLLGLAFSPNAPGDEDGSKHLIEVGTLQMGMNSPDYPASDQNHNHYLIVPFFHYSGKNVRSDSEGLFRYRFVDKDFYGIDLSFSGSFPAKSRDNALRNGMSDLVWLGELGPRFFYYFHRTPKHQWRLNIPLRAVVSTDFTTTNARGLVFAPGISSRHTQVFGTPLDWSFSWSFNYASQELMSYFYEVPRENATATRPEYGAKAGFLGTDIGTTLRMRKDNFIYFIGLKSSFHDGAANENSPMFRTKQNNSIHVGFVWIFFESKEKGFE